MESRIWRATWCDDKAIESNAACITDRLSTKVDAVLTRVIKRFRGCPC